MPAVGCTAPRNSIVCDDDGTCTESGKIDNMTRLRQLAKSMTKGADKATRTQFKELLKTQDPRGKPVMMETKVILPARWQEYPETLPGRYCGECKTTLGRDFPGEDSAGSVILRRTVDAAGNQGCEMVPAPNGFENGEILFSDFRQDRRTVAEPEGPGRGRTCRCGPIILRGQVTSRSRSAPAWCACPDVVRESSRSSSCFVPLFVRCDEGSKKMADARTLSLTPLQQATDQIAVSQPKKKKKKLRVDLSLELRQQAHWNAWMAQYDMSKAFKGVPPIEEKPEPISEIDVEGNQRDKENIPPDWDQGSISYMESSPGIASRSVYALAVARNPEGGKELGLKAMIDPGNVTKKGMVISRDFQKRLGVPFEQICQGKIGTAGHGKPMRAMGTTEMFELHLKGISKKFLVSATVIEDLVDDMNLGTSFLQSITGITGEALAMEFHEGGTKLKIGRETIDLVCTLEDDKKPTGGIRIRTPAAINEASIQLERMADEEGPDKGLGIAAVAAGQTIRKPEVFAKAKGLAWSNLKGERDIPFGLAEHPKKMMAPVQGLGDPDNRPGMPYPGLQPWVNLNAVVQGGIPGSLAIEKRPGVTHPAISYNPRQVVPMGPSQVKLLGPDPPWEDIATVVGRGRSLTVRPRTGFLAEGDKARIRSMARKKHGPCFPIKTLQDAVLDANSVSFLRIPRVAGLAMMEPMPTDIPAQVMLIPAVYDRTERVAVINMHNEPLGIPQGVEIGYCIPLQQKVEEPEGDDEEGVDPLDKGLTKGVNNLNDGEETTKALADPQQLFEDLKLEESAILQKNPKLMKRVKDLITEYRDIFSCPDQLIGKTNLCEFSVELQPNARPHKAKLRPLNPAQKLSLKEQLAKWQQGSKEDWIAEECESPWAAALVPVQKKNGETRWAVDYRPLNAVTVKDSYPLPNIQENLEKLQGSKVFSTLDAAGAYHTVPVAETTKPLLAFTTPYGLFTFNRMPFGATNAGQTYVRFMEMQVNKLRSPYTLAYVDDLIAHTPDVELHMDELKKVFQMHREAGIRLGAKKTTLFASEANYLGYRVTAAGIAMQEKYVDKVLQWPKPETGKQLATFLGFCGYYRSFITNFAWLTSEMNSQKREKKVTWTEAMDHKFTQLKELFGKKPIRAYPKYGPKDEPFEVWPDFSAAALGFVIQQVQGGERRLIAAGGRKTTQGESNYAPTKGELAAIVHALRKFEHILRYRPFIIYTDHAALKWLKSMKNPRGIFFRWLQELSSYEFEIHHVPGKSTGAADGLSRSEHLPDPTPEEEAESVEFVGHVGDNLADDMEVPDEGVLEAARWNRAGLKQAQEEDEVLGHVKRWVKGARPTKEEVRGLPQDAWCYYKQLEVLDVDEGDTLIRRKKDKGGKQLQQILIPEAKKLKDEVFKWSHVHPSAGHFGVEATVARAQLKFYWPGMYGNLKADVAACEVCLAKQQKVNTHHTEHQPRRHGYPGEVLYVDLVGPMPKSHKDNLFICTMQDGFSKYVTAVMIPCKEAPVVANAVLEGWITKFGCPDRIHTDQGTEFKNKLWKDLMDRLQITKTETPPYNPHSNLVERFHRCLNAIMRCYMDRGDRNWEAYIPMCCFAYNTKINSTTGITPFEGWMGRPAKLPIDLIIPAPERVYGDENEFIRETERRFQTMYSYMRNNSEAGFKRNAKLYSGSSEEFNEGDLCWIFSKRKVEGKPQKITDAWLGPYRVLGRPAKCLLKVEPADVDGRPFTVHMTRVRKFRGALIGNKHRPPKEPVLGDDPDEQAQEVGGPEEFVEPADALVVPVQMPSEPEEITDVIKPPPPVPPKKVAPRATQAKATQSDMRPPWRQSKRVRFSDTEAGPEAVAGPSGKGAKPSQGEKRKGATSPGTTHKKPKTRWTELLTDESEDELMLMERDTPSTSSEHSSDSDTVQTLTTEELTICVLPGTKLPEKASTGAAGWDCRATQTINLEPGRTAKIPLGISMAIPKGWCGMLLSRSKLASEGITVEAGLIDSDYRGPVLCVLRNGSDAARRIQCGERICQLVFVPAPSINWTTVDDLDATDRGQNGFGSTGDA